MRSILAIARLTVLEALRSKLLVMLALFILGLLVGSQFIQYFTLGEQVKIFKDLCVGLFSLFIAILAIVLPIEQMQRAKEGNILTAVLVKPVERYIFIAGKYLGFCMVLALVNIAMTALILLMAQWRGAGFDSNVVKAACMILCQGWVLASWAVLIGVLFSSYFLSVLSGISVYLLGNMLEPLREWVEHAQSTAGKGMAILVLYLVPHLENLNMQDSVALGEFVSWHYIAVNLGYSLAYVAVVAALTIVAFNQKDL